MNTLVRRHWLFTLGLALIGMLAAAAPATPPPPRLPAEVLGGLRDPAVKFVQNGSLRAFQAGLTENKTPLVAALKSRFDAPLAEILGGAPQISYDAGTTFYGGMEFIDAGDHLFTRLSARAQSDQGTITILAYFNLAHPEAAQDEPRSLERTARHNSRVPVRLDPYEAFHSHTSDAGICQWVADDYHLTITVRVPGRNADATALAQRAHGVLAREGLYDFRKWLLGLQAAPPPRAAPSKPAVELLDVNSLYTDWRKVERMNLGELAELAATPLPRRRAVATDGVSGILVRFSFDLPGRADLRIANATAQDGRLYPLHGGQTVEHGGRHHAFAIYLPPERFDTDLGDFVRARLDDRVESRFARFTAHLHPPDEADDAPFDLKNFNEFEFMLVRPPVVLVHGTYSNPERAWKTAANDPRIGTVSMYDRLTAEGFCVFMVDYARSNGDHQSWLSMGEASDFVSNSRVVWGEGSRSMTGRTGGLAEAMRVYRDELNVACCRAMVVGHSLGGLLARIHASEAYNPGGYIREDNFVAGDIQRLITLGTPHFGSDLPRVLRELSGARFGDRGFLETIVANRMVALADASSGFHTGATRDQIPGSEALKKIGPTRVWSHAIACVSRAPDLRDFDGEYRKLFLQVSWAFSRFPGLFDQVFAEGGAAQQADARRLRETIELAQWDSWIGDQDAPIPNEETLMLLLRAAIFGNTRNDCTVRLESQWGGIDLEAATTLEGVLHGPAPRYTSVQDAIVRLLKGPHELFSFAGFPDAGQPCTNLEPGLVRQSSTERAAAIQASNMVPEHAEAFSEVARRRDEIVIVRPVNRHAQSLIARNAATKGMHVKGKSSDWGPHAGYIPVQQKFSKLANLPEDQRDAEVGKYTHEVMLSLEQGRATAKPFIYEFNGVRYAVMYEVNYGATMGPDLVLKHPATGQYYDEKDPSRPPNPPYPADGGNTYQPLELLANRRGVLLTADYDLLAVGIRGEPEPLPAQPDPERGYITSRQIQLLADLNRAVAVRGYTGGNVVHHGPETQFAKSPGVDYPNTVFEPDGDIITIVEGPPGQKDMYLKRYFAAMRRAGWSLRPNPRWNWDHPSLRPYSEAQGWDDADGPKPADTESDDHDEAEEATEDLPDLYPR